MIPAVMMIAMSPRPTWVKYGYIAVGLAVALFIYFPIYIKGWLV
jgi:hypothetical protein